MWTTRDELAFLDGIGAWCNDKPVTAAARIFLLTKYLESLKLRSSWAALNRATIEDHVNTRIRQLSKLEQTSTL
jgi:hypothetical protein